MADRADLGIIDLTTVAAPDIRVKLRRADDTFVIYRIPGNAPSGLLVELMVLLREIDAAPADDLELIADLRVQVQEKVDELFAIRNKDYEEGEVKLGDDELAVLVAGLFQRYYGGDPDGGEGGGRPTTAEGEPEPEPEAETASSPSTAQRPRSERRSPASSRRRTARPRSSTSSPT